VLLVIRLLKLVLLIRTARVTLGGIIIDVVRVGTTVLTSKRDIASIPRKLAFTFVRSTVVIVRSLVKRTTGINKNGFNVRRALAKDISGSNLS
jgi:hypothetical protein